MTRRRRLLFLAYWVPPRTAIGTLRSVNLLKHLPKFGWDITTITPAFDEDDGTQTKLGLYVETGYIDVKGWIKRFAPGRNGNTASGSRREMPIGTERSMLRRIKAEVLSVVSFPDEYVGWLPYATRATSKLIARGGWDALLTSAPPMSANIAAALSHGSVPWIADLRDLWAENDSNERTIMQRLFDNRVERATLSRAAALTAASELSMARYAHRYPRKPCFAIYNGFDSEEWQAVQFRTEERCTILYAGELYGGKRDPSMLFAALRAILDENLASSEELRVDFYAPADPWLLQRIAQYRLEEVVRVHGFIPRANVLAAQRRADRLLVLSWDGHTAEGVVAGKVFEYFGARRPVLALGGPARFALDDLLRETGAGVRCKTIEETKVELLAALCEHRRGAPRVIRESAVKNYCGEACARRFAEVLDLVVPLRVRT